MLLGAGRRRLICLDMIIIIEPHNACDYSELMYKMFRLRARVFRDRLGWDVQVIDGIERDKYDDKGPVYLVYSDAEAKKVKACLRLLPTTGPTVLADFFADTVPDAFHISSPDIWECTRFCVEDREEVLSTSAVMLYALGAFAVKSGIKSIIGNFDSAILRLYRRLGCKVDILGSTRRYGHPVYLGLFPVSEANLTSLSKGDKANV